MTWQEQITDCQVRRQKQNYQNNTMCQHQSYSFVLPFSLLSLAPIFISFSFPNSSVNTLLVHFSRITSLILPIVVLPNFRSTHSEQRQHNCFHELSYKHYDGHVHTVEWFLHWLLAHLVDQHVNLLHMNCSVYMY